MSFDAAPPDAPSWLRAFFVILPLLVAGLFVGAVVRTAPPERRTRDGILAAALTAGWLTLGWVAAASGALARLDLRPPPYALLMASLFVLALTLGLSPLGRRLALGLPIAALVGFQAFRLPLELVMHEAARLEVMPPALSYGGYNFDILTGTTAIPVAALAVANRLPRWVLVAWNLLGFVCLAAIAAIAVATSPAIRAFGDAPRNVNTWVLHPPFVWLPMVLVAVALIGHIVLARRLVLAAGRARA